ncbi:MAG TPA: lipopolysaccharide kinase InaA family protein [Candidatus Binataceae bacterium]|nr:lipopolysaccharide kinase InaA family protein [Candidatus Binataceae bacterium]
MEGDKPAGVIGGWQLTPLDDLAELGPGGARILAETCLQNRQLLYRSRHACTYLAKLAHGAGEIELFVKVYQPARGLYRLKEKVRGSRADNVIRISRRLHELGLSSPRLLMVGREQSSGLTMLVSLRAHGVGLPQLCAEGIAMRRKRRLLAALGAEVARLHRAGLVHGDLTPHNILVQEGDPPRFILLDHDRTRPAYKLIGRRRQLRNLVQLGRFDLPGLSQTDRLRLFRSYGAGLAPGRYRAILRKTARMLAARRAKEAR